MKCPEGATVKTPKLSLENRPLLVNGNIEKFHMACLALLFLRREASCAGPEIERVVINLFSSSYACARRLWLSTGDVGSVQDAIATDIGKFTDALRTYSVWNSSSCCR